MFRTGKQTTPYNGLWIIGCSFCCSWGICLTYVANKNQEFIYQKTPQNTLWPQPRHQTVSADSQILTLDPASFRLVPWPPDPALECDVVREALDRYTWLVTPDKNARRNPRYPELLQINVTVRLYKDNSHCGYPPTDSNETYVLQISAEPPKAVLISETVWGMLRGLETFSQLVYRDEETNSYLVSSTSVADWPWFSHRGVLLDTARHFITLKILKKNLDAMAYNKMNVFHWHMVDDQSFPFQSKIHPNLTAMGAFSSKHVYRHEDIREVVEYARLRGIRVIPELDTPGHTKAIGKAFPELLTRCHYNSLPLKLPNRAKPMPASGLDPTNEDTYRLMKDLLAEIKSLFPDPYIHLGMDETNIKCWISNPSIQRFLVRNKFSAKDLEEYYARRVINLTESLEYRYVIWADPLENGVEVNPETVVQLWKADWIIRAKQVAWSNHQMVLSSCWYIDLVQYGETWTKYYKCNPLIFSRNATERQLMLGGEACLWGEYIDNTNLLQTLWPSASAVAERLWHGGEALYPDDHCRVRFDQQRCRMLRRGIPASPVYSGFCEEDYFEEQSSSRIILELPFDTRPNVMFVWLFVVISVLCALYWVTLSRPLFRSICLRLCSAKAVSRNHYEAKMSRT